MADNADRIAKSDNAAKPGKGQGCLTLIFHRITAANVDANVNDRFSVTRDSFCRLLDAVASCPASFLITFDDGHESDYSIALGELLRRKLRAVFFVVPKWVGRPGYLNWSQIQEIGAAGMTIGSHTMSHVCLTAASHEKTLEEFALSREAIEKAVGKKVSDLALPGGFGNAHIEDMALSCGYNRIYTSIPGIWNQKTMLIPRICVREQMTPRTLIRISKNKFSLYLQNELFKYRFRETVGPERYLSLYSKIKRLRKRFQQFI